MPIPIYNIISSAGLDPDNMQSIENSEINVNKIKSALKRKWEDQTISDDDICNDSIDSTGAPDWIKKTIEQERLAIQHEIKTG